MLRALERFCIFSKKEKKAMTLYCNDSSQKDGFYNTCAACTGTKKTLRALDENTHLCAFLRGGMKPVARADEGSERCCCCCCCSYFVSRGSCGSCSSCCPFLTRKVSVYRCTLIPVILVCGYRLFRDMSNFCLAFAYIEIGCPGSGWRGC